MTVLAVAVGLAASAAAQPARAPAPPPERVWLDAAGQPLPFASEEEILAFLREAVEVEREPIPVGVTRPFQIVLEHAGVRAHACFRYHHSVGTNRRMKGGHHVMFFRDSHTNEVAAYRLSRLLGLDWIPPTVARKLGRQEGSLQLWVEGATTFSAWKEEHGGNILTESPRLADQVKDMRIFDNLINNIDRNAGNLMFLPAPDGDRDLILIDHTRAFGRDKRLAEPEHIARCSRRLWNGLQSLDRSTIVDTLGPIIGGAEARAVAVRRDLLVALIDKRIRAMGEEKVIVD